MLNIIFQTYLKIKWCCTNNPNCTFNHRIKFSIIFKLLRSILDHFWADFLARKYILCKTFEFGEGIKNGHGYSKVHGEKKYFLMTFFKRYISIYIYIFIKNVTILGQQNKLSYDSRGKVGLLLSLSQTFLQENILFERSLNLEVE